MSEIRSLIEYLILSGNITVLFDTRLTKNENILIRFNMIMDNSVVNLETMYGTSETSPIIIYDSDEEKEPVAG